MKRLTSCLIFGTALLMVLGPLALDCPRAEESGEKAALSGASAVQYTGSTSCRKCHEKFYQLWAPSHHGLAMQPYTLEFARKRLTDQTEDIVIGNFRYRADISGPQGWVVERGPAGEKKYRIDHTMGGKNVYYFLTALDRGRLQTLPIAYNVHQKKWFDMAASGIRHFPGHSDAPMSWKDWRYHVQHRVLWVSREPGVYQLRSGNRYLSHGLERTRHQL